MTADNELVERAKLAILDAMDITDGLDAEAAETYARAALAVLPSIEQQARLIENMREGLSRAIETLAASRHLIGKYVPDHHWLPEHDKRIDEARSALSR